MENLNNSGQHTTKWFTILILTRVEVSLDQDSESTKRCHVADTEDLKLMFAPQHLRIDVLPDVIYLCDAHKMPEKYPSGCLDFSPDDQVIFAASLLPDTAEILSLKKILYRNLRPE